MDEFHGKSSSLSTHAGSAGLTMAPGALPPRLLVGRMAVATVAAATCVAATAVFFDLTLILGFFGGDGFVDGGAVAAFVVTWGVGSIVSCSTGPPVVWTISVGGPCVVAW